MQSFIQQLILSTPFLQKLPAVLVFLIFQLVFCAVILAFAAIFAMIAGWAERRIAGRIQSRIGPNRAGPHGVLQSVADGLKVFTKEDIIPTHADHILFKIAPYLVFLGMLLAFVVMPFSSQWVIADLDLGIFYLLAVETLVVIGIVMSGWASNNKWSLLGGMRGAAQIVSYELPVSLTILAVVLWNGTMSVQGIIQAQGAWPWEWNIFQTPFLFVGFFILFTGSLAEGNRTPFDMPETESELVSGFNTEYSGFRFIVFFFAEWANIYLIGAISTVVFLGGWNAGPLPGAIIHLFGLSPGFAATLIQNVIELCVFQVKALSLAFIVMQLRWTLPRVRVDQLMALCWKYLVPVSFVNLLAMAIWCVVVSETLTKVSAAVMTTVGFVIGIYFVYRVIWQLRFTKAKIGLNPFI